MVRDQTVYFVAAIRRQNDTYLERTWFVSRTMMLFLQI